MTKPQATRKEMGRRSVLALGFAAICLPLPALAQDFVARIEQQLRDQGYTRITIERTWLGRTRILGSGASGRREIILNPNTGEILRDVWQGGNESDDRIIDDDGGKGRGRGGDDDDDRDDDDSGSSGGSGSDDDDDSDNDKDSGGGGGGGNSGSGSGGGDDDDD